MTIWIVVGLIALLLVGAQLLAPSMMAKLSKRIRNDRYDSGDSDPGAGDF